MAAASSCTDAFIEPTRIESTQVDNRLELKGRVCTSPARASDFPVKVILLVDQSGSMCVSDPPGPDGKLRSSCSSDHDIDPESPGEAEASGEACGGASGDLSREGLGRQKLIVTLPELGGFAVIDAQTLLEDERYAEGGFAPCEIERWVPLQVTLAVTGPGSVCVCWPDAAQVQVDSTGVAVHAFSASCSGPSGSLRHRPMSQRALNCSVCCSISVPGPCERTSTWPLQRVRARVLPQRRPTCTAM